MDKFDLYFRKADLDQDGRISGNEALAFFQASNLPRQVLAQIWTYADQNRTGFLGRTEFYNALKLVTVAQSKRDLTPDMVRSALYGPASAKIPVPEINLAALPAALPNTRPTAPNPQFSGAVPTASQTTVIRGPPGLQPQQNQLSQTLPSSPLTAFQPHQGIANHGVRVPMPVSGLPSSSSISAGWLGEGVGVSQTGATSQAPSTTQDGFVPRMSGLITSSQPRSEVTTAVMQPTAPNQTDASLVANQPKEDSKALIVSGNGFASDPIFGDVFSETSVKKTSMVPVSSASGIPVPSTTVSSSVRPQTSFKPSPLGPSQSTQQPSVNLYPQLQQPAIKHNQPGPNQSPSVYPGGAVNSSLAKPHLQWPKMSQSSVQKYSKVFMEVDTDRDGKITGEQARNLFLSWKLPREILKQVWDLSDQDNDSNLSLREFCIALYLMERYREGLPLPPALPSYIFEDSQLPASGQHAAAYANAGWRHAPGLPQTQGMPGPRPSTSAGGKPPRPVPIPHPDEESGQRSQQKPKVPVLEKHLVDQLSTEEQNSLNSKFKELTEADKKVSDLEKEILDAKEKIDFYRTKMQELILYKSRCDRRLNEITERVSADKREVESLARKYEDKYKQSGDIASKLTIEEATFRDIQDKKMELYRAIVKLEQEGSADKIQVLADRIQLDLEEQVKALNERCKTYGLRAKPTTLVELPFGWQTGIQEGAADWDEEWDKFEDEGFVFVKELTLDVQNVIAPPKLKISLVQKENSASAESETVPSSNADGKSMDLQGDGKKNFEHELENTHEEEGIARSPPASPASKNVTESPSKKFQDSPSKKSIESDGSPRTLENHSEHEGAESVLSEDRRFDEPAWGSFDTHYDTDAGWDFNNDTEKELDHSKHNNEALLFGPDNWGLSPIKTESTEIDSMFQKKSTYAFADSVPSTPMSSYGTTPHADNMFQKKSPFAFADSVPSTPMSSYGTSLFADNTFQKKSPFGFADSVPSTPMYNSGNSPQGFNAGSEDHSFDNLSRFDSFNMNDGELFPSREFSRFDSMRSTTEYDSDHGSFFQPQDSFARFDSFRSTADSDFNSVFAPRESFTRFDSISSTRDSNYGHGFPSFDDKDSFGSSDLFKTSVASETPKGNSDSWKAF